MGFVVHVANYVAKVAHCVSLVSSSGVSAPIQITRVLSVQMIVDDRRRCSSSDSHSDIYGQFVDGISRYGLNHAALIHVGCEPSAPPTAISQIYTAGVPPTRPLAPSWQVYGSSANASRPLSRDQLSPSTSA